MITMTASLRLAALLAVALLPSGTRALVRRSPEYEQAFDGGWLFFRGTSPVSQAACAAQFPVDLGQTQCLGLQLQGSAGTPQACQAACCGAVACQTWQFCPAGSGCEVRLACDEDGLVGLCGYSWSPRGVARLLTGLASHVFMLNLLPLRRSTGSILLGACWAGRRGCWELLLDGRHGQLPEHHRRVGVARTAGKPHAARR